MFLDHTEWAAYDDLKEIRGDQEWQSLHEEFEQQFADDRQGRIALYIHDDDLEKAVAELKDSEDLSLLKRYREPVASVAPVEYFERYRELLVPFAAGETGRRHYRETADHLEEMQELVPEERCEEFVGFLKDEHSNRPAFLDELEKAGFWPESLALLRRFISDTGPNCSVGWTKRDALSPPRYCETTVSSSRGRSTDVQSRHGT